MTVHAVLETRTDAEVASLRAAAAAAQTASTRRRRARGDAVAAALDWVADDGPAPMSGLGVGADVEAIGFERVRALDAERAAITSGEDGTFPGVVALTLGWFLRREHADTPLY